MPARKIQDEGEVRRWYDEGLTYQWMVDEYLRKYNIDTTVQQFSNLRWRRGWPKRLARYMDLVPWRVRHEHLGRYPVAMLRRVARMRNGAEMSDADMERIESWLASLKEENAVVHYDPNTEEGFFYVPRRAGIDTDLIRVPDDPHVIEHDWSTGA